MADYCTPADVRARMIEGGLIDEQIKKGPKPETITNEIALVTNQVNVAFKSADITLPITDTDVLGLLKLKCSREVVYQVMTMRGAAIRDDVEPFYAGWHKEFTDPEDRTGLLEQIEDEGLAALIVDSGEPWCTGMDSTDGDEFAAKVTKDQVF
jgi:hypothetical protein